MQHLTEIATVVFLSVQLGGLIIFSMSLLAVLYNAIWTNQNYATRKRTRDAAQGVIFGLLIWPLIIYFTLRGIVNIIENTWQAVIKED